MSAPRRVLHVDTAAEWRGGQQQLLHLLAGRPGDAWAGVPDGELARRIGAPAIALRPAADPRNILALRRGLVGLPDVALLAAHTPHAHGLALFAGRPVVVHRRVDFVPRHAWKYRRAAGIIAVSEGVRRVLIAEGVPGTSVRVVHDGVVLPVAGALPADLAWVRELPGPRLLCAGALVPHKGHIYAVEAMVAAPGHLLLAGEGPLQAELVARARALGVAERVHFLGYVEALAALFAEVDLFVHPSVEEGMGQVLVEAMGAGLRIAATSAGGIPEVVGEVAELATPGDAAALTAAILRALARPTGQGIGRAGHFSVARMVAETSEAYASFAFTSPPAP